MLRIKAFTKNSKYNVLVLRCQNQRDTFKRVKSYETLTTPKGANHPSLSFCSIQHNPYLDFFNNLSWNNTVEKNEYEILIEMCTLAEKREHLYKQIVSTKQLLHNYVKGSDAYDFLLGKHEIKIAHFNLQLQLMQKEIYTKQDV
ncbi:Hypothetical_protein [Hexamita inflata]|uniref:Hypothetical_protein n=1 Tax=Hexamita inflata TaxID=28002 RepID=A0AA86P3Q5_9EUKA|nr:Hypothetical protein HINF_LOCUS19362 [Hexamita inflata]